MNRELLECRAKDYNGKWVYGLFFPLGDDGCFVDKRTHVLKPLQEQTVCRFIGQKDFKGDKIYEGDVLKSLLDVNGKEEIFVVIWDSKKSAFMAWSNQSTILVDLYDIGPSVRIKGNVYDNPELLKPFNIEKAVAV